MSGETDLAVLLAQLTPVMDDQDYVFVSVPLSDLSLVSHLSVRGMFRETEGMTLICEQTIADEYGLVYDGIFRCITCHVHSSLEAVGLTAAFSSALAVQGISANVIAGYYHDHIFVPATQADAALTVLQGLG